MRIVDLAGINIMEVAINAVIATRAGKEEFTVPTIIEVVMFNADEEPTIFKNPESKHRHRGLGNPTKSN